MGNRMLFLSTRTLASWSMPARPEYKPAVDPDGEHMPDVVFVLRGEEREVDELGARVEREAIAIPRAVHAPTATPRTPMSKLTASVRDQRPSPLRTGSTESMRHPVRALARRGSFQCGRGKWHVYPPGLRIR